MVVQTPSQLTMAAGRRSVSMAVSLVHDWSGIVWLPKVRERLGFGVVGGVLVGSGVGVGSRLGGVYGPDDGELVQGPQPLSLPARTPTIYVLELSALKVRLVPRTFLWSLTGACQLPPPSVL